MDQPKAVKLSKREESGPSAQERRQVLMRKLGISLPIMQAPMARHDLETLVAEVSNNGCLGNLGCGLLNGAQLEEEIKKVVAKTDKPFGVNFMITQDEPIRSEQVDHVDLLLKPVRQQLNLPTPQRTPDQLEQAARSKIPEQLEVIYKYKPRFVSFCFGLLDKEVIAKLREFAVVAGSANTVEEARILEAYGCDAIIAQGSEAGGHRATWTTKPELGLIGSISLIPQVVDAVSVPVIAAGGITDARQIKAAMALGASAVMMGTAFLATLESAIIPGYRDLLVSSGRFKGVDTTVTQSFTGRMVRCLNNEWVEMMHKFQDQMTSYQIQRSLCQDIHDQKQPNFMLLHAGQSRLLAKKEPVKDLIERLQTGISPFLEVVDRL